MKIYTFGQQTNRQGRIAGVDLEDDQITGDVDLWGEGTEDELIAQAREAIEREYSGSIDANNQFRACIAHDVLDYFEAECTCRFCQ